MYPHVYLFFVVTPENAHTHTHVNERLARERPTPLSPTKAHSTYIFAYSGESQKKEELDFCSKSFSLIARALSAHTFKRSRRRLFLHARLSLGC